jgi:hypothetical protein
MRDEAPQSSIGAPVVTFNGTKAIVETNSEVLGENVRLGIACDSHARFYDRVEKRDGVWRISHRASVYDMGTFLPDQDVRN